MKASYRYSPAAFALLILIVVSMAGTGAPALSAAAPAGPVATVDLKKVFEGHFKTKLASATLEDEAKGLMKDRKALIDDYQKAADDYKKSLEEANNQALSADEREKRKKDAEGKLVKANDLRQSLEQFEKIASSNMEEKHRIAKEKILAEIRTVITAKAKAAGFVLVLDSAAESFNRTGVILYDSGANDLTESVLKELNANAPTEPPADDKKPDEKKK